MPTAKEVKEQANAALIQSARDKLDRGEAPTVRELNTLEKHEDATTRQYGHAYMTACPKKDVIKETGLPTASLHNLDDKHGVPFRGETVNMWAVVVRLCQLPNEFRLKGIRNRGEPKLDEMLEEDGDDGWQDLCYQEKYFKLRDERLLRHKQIVPLELVQKAHQQWAGRLRSLGHDLGVKFGAEAQDMLSGALDDCVTSIDSVLSEWDDSYIESIIENPEGDDKQLTEANSEVSKTKKNKVKS